ncbi:MAG: hypothetical protein INR71_15770 [Terriglobus roseus]|nr:hypothetical protein [Terriglobus roseus]
MPNPFPRTMALSKALVSLLLTGAALATPVTHEDLASLANTKELWVRQDAGSCRNQSCEIAAVSGSTGSTVYQYNTYPVGDTQDGDCCIVR